MLKNQRNLNVTIDVTEDGQEAISTVVGGAIVTVAVAGFYKCATAAVKEIGAIVRTCSNNRASKKEAELNYKTHLAECKMEEIK